MVRREAPAFGEQLQRYRVRAGLTQEELAERAALGASTISALERGARRHPYVNTRQRLAVALGLSKGEELAFVPAWHESRQRKAASEPAIHPPPTNLPAPRDPLIGRAAEVAALRGLILRGEPRLVTLTGVGGCGKTRLALEVAREIVAYKGDNQTPGPRYPGGVWLVELAPAADPSFVPQVLATTLGVQESPGVPLVDTLAVRLGLQQLLLVLDNCERVIDACANVAGRLLEVCPALQILATSREPLQIAGEQQWRVPPLRVPEFDWAAPLDDLRPYPAVQLFTTRATAADPGFALTEANARAVAQICARLDGIPLALELAAARVRVLPVGQILTRLDDTLQLLTGSRRGVPSRQQTLRSTFDWSYKLLTGSEQAAFRRLAVFAGSFDLVAAAAVIRDGFQGVGDSEAGTEPDTSFGSSDILDVLTALVDKSLVVVEAEAEGDLARYRLLEPVRQYASEQLAAAAEREAAQARQAMHYLALAERAQPELRGPAQVAWLQRLEREGHNLRTALQWATSHTEAASGLRLAVALTPFWEGHGYLSEGRHWFQMLFVLVPAGGVPASLRAQALLCAGRLAQWQTDLNEAAEALDKALTLAQAEGDHLVVAAAMVWLGIVARRQGSFERASVLLEESLALSRRAGDSAGTAFALLNLGVTRRFQGDLAGSARLLEESLAHFRVLGDVRCIAMTLTMLGYTELWRGELQRAAILIREGLAGHRAVGDRAFLVFGLLGLAAVLAEQSQPGFAARLLGAMLALQETLGAPLAPINETTYGPLVAVVRRRLSEPDFAAAMNEGRAAPFDQLVMEALATSPPLSAAPAAPIATMPEALTARQAEVAQLLAQGYTDRQIAATLAISVRTAGVHVQHVLAKLDLRSRWQVADRTVSFRLPPQPGEPRT